MTTPNATVPILTHLGYFCYQCIFQVLVEYITRTIHNIIIRHYTACDLLPV